MTALQHTVPPSFTSIAGLASIPCAACGTALLIESDAPALQLCRRCLCETAVAEAAGIGTLIRDLAAGVAPFNVLSAEDRKRQLEYIATAVTYALVKAGETPTYVFSREDEPSEDDKATIYAMEEILDREETVAAG